MFNLYSYIGTGEQWAGGDCFIDSFLKHQNRMYRICLVIAHGEFGFHVKSTSITEFKTAEAGNECYKCFAASAKSKTRPAYIDKNLELYGITSALKKIDYAIFCEV